MWWRSIPAEYKQHAGEANREIFEQLVATRRAHGVLGYLHDQPIGWCSLGPREAFSRLPRSRYWKPVDGQQVWAIVCFFINPLHRRRGVASHLLEASIQYAASLGVKILEAFPKDVGTQTVEDRSIYFGTTAMYSAAGFVEVARRHPHFPIRRLRIK